MIVKGNIRYRYPWHLLDEVGKTFLIERQFETGYRHARQLVYAKNQTAKRQGSPVSYKCTKTDAGMLVSRVA